MKSEWKKPHIHKHGMIWNKRAGEGLSVTNPTAFIYLYNKGDFRGKEDQWVISTSLTGGSNPRDRQDTGFKTKSEALEYARKFRETN